MATFEPAWLPLAVGSVPYSEAAEAWSAVLRHLPGTPFWPQMPRRSFRENMYAQYSEGFPGVVLEEERVYVDRRRDLDPALERLYLAYLENDLSYGAISAEYSAGLAALREGRVLLEQPPALIKGQVTGPVSWGLTVVDQERRPLLYDEVLADAIAKHLRLKAAWQEQALAPYAEATVIFIDEPYLSAFGSAFVAVNRDQVVELLHEVLAGISGLKGIHCCGNTDWSMLLETPIDILNLDAYEYAGALALYPSEVRAFLDRGGMIAWGIVPAGEAAQEETPEHLVQRLHEAMGLLVEKGVPPELLLQRGLVAPSCGTGSLSAPLAERVLGLTNQVSQIMRDRYVTQEEQPS
ncbi:MAG TPA: methionine synthase [Anaerolineae bacterium]|nr:methionine synthase [Anaerolineae bacterium]HOR00133.1 methionine synthase [Anaerolineae bacterium]HPL28841.1 methionine synthase [Anaerolineae bacterium]